MAVDKGRFSAEAHPGSEDLLVLSHQAMMLPLFPSHWHTLTNGQGYRGSAPASVGRGCSGCPVLTRTTGHLGVSPQGSHKRTGVEMGA